MNRRSLAVVACVLSFGAGAAFAAKVRDWHDLDAVHNKIVSAIKDMERARAANHYDMDGHGIKAEQMLRDAEKELHEAIESARSH